MGEPAVISCLTRETRIISEMCAPPRSQTEPLADSWLCKHPLKTRSHTQWILFKWTFSESLCVCVCVCQCCIFHLSCTRMDRCSCVVFISSNIETSSAATLGNQALRGFTGCSTASLQIEVGVGSERSPRRTVICLSSRPPGLRFDLERLTPAPLVILFISRWFRSFTSVMRGRVNNLFWLLSNAPSELGDVSEAQQHSFQTCWQQNQPWQLKTAPLCSLHCNKSPLRECDSFLCCPAHSLPHLSPL